MNEPPASSDEPQAAASALAAVRVTFVPGGATRTGAILETVNELESVDPADDVAGLLRRAAAAGKCAPCGCAHDTVAAIRSNDRLPGEVLSAAGELASRLVEVRYDCLGCHVCWPAVALGHLTDGGLVDAAPACPTEPAEPRAGWPPLPGSYTVARWASPVAVCTLSDSGLAAAVAASNDPAVSIVGTLATENLGIERLVRNTITNPNLRFLVVAGTETRHAVGHLPGASLFALAAHGTDPTRRIIDAPGRRPVLANLADEEIARFRDVVEVIDLIGCTDPAQITEAIAAAAARDPGPAEVLKLLAATTPTAGYLGARMTPDPAGYFVIYPDTRHGLLRLEHYSTIGVFDAVIEGPTPAHCYTAAIDSGLLTRLDHAAYLGRELARADACLQDGQPYVQDAAPESTKPPAEPTSCGDPGCGTHCP